MYINVYCPIYNYHNYSSKIGYKICKYQVGIHIGMILKPSAKYRPYILCILARVITFLNQLVLGIHEKNLNYKTWIIGSHYISQVELFLFPALANIRNKGNEKIKQEKGLKKMLMQIMETKFMLNMLITWKSDKYSVLTTIIKTMFICQITHQWQSKFHQDKVKRGVLPITALRRQMTCTSLRAVTHTYIFLFPPSPDIRNEGNYK